MILIRKKNKSGGTSGTEGPAGRKQRMNTKILVGLAIAGIVAVFLNCPDAHSGSSISARKHDLHGTGRRYSRDSSMVDLQRLARNKPAEEAANPHESRRAAKKPERRESLPWAELMQAAAEGNDAVVMRLVK
jgi:hypothetical protein